MKTNAPENIYLQEPTKVRTEKKYDNDIEYTRTDAFIEKACAWLNEHADDDDYTWYDETEYTSGITDKFIEDFRKYMEGE